MVKHILSVAPMLDCTDRHFRHLIRLISRQILLYTEMLTTNELFSSVGALHLTVQHLEPPIALQLGGSDPSALAQCAKMASDAGFSEVNLNVGCPSSRVQQGGIGACLMRQPLLVAECIAAMRQVTAIPVTTKCRLGVDHDDSYEQLCYFVEQVASAGCEKFIIHARKAWLQGLSPKQNRTIPPLDYAKVYQLKKDFDHLEIIINGGIQTLEQVDQHLALTDGVMMGRAIYNNPLLLAEVDSLYYGQHSVSPDPASLMDEYMDYIEEQLAQGVRLSILARHVLNVFQGRPRAKLWRRLISTNSHRANAGIEVISAALTELRGV